MREQNDARIHLSQELVLGRGVAGGVPVCECEGVRVRTARKRGRSRSGDVLKQYLMTPQGVLQKQGSQLGDPSSTGRNAWTHLGWSLSGEARVVVNTPPRREAMERHPRLINSHDDLLGLLEFGDDLGGLALLAFDFQRAISRAGGIHGCGS